MASYHDRFHSCKCTYQEECNRDCSFYRKISGTLSNADRIRQMTDEELAKLLNDAESDGRVYGPKGKVAWEKWLRQECDPNE